ncbi:IS4 family transposase [Rhodanobacter sp. T12-5]|uniref:IS4 family transposase n=1 Tax=Rhodanobacter sp. T12-5 TaxID=2024611 RepID=UPI0011F03D0A|nr:IS4 family transposase [Rhodanobacter sp. T12-5]KAA0068215.1 IS4 family transposase [Rhodanobacter sp. T12-5]
MRATKVLQKCLDDALGSMHALRSRVLLRAVEAMIHGSRLTLIDLARSWPGAERVRAPLKALDRLLGNCHLHVEREHIYQAMTRWLVRSKQPVILIDWSDLKSDRSWHLLRAAIPVGGRSLPILDMVFPGGKQGSPKAEKLFLKRLAHVLPADVRPILVTDAGFRGPWFQAVEAMGWQWLGRLRNRTYLKPVEVADEPGQWVTCKAMYALATRDPRDFGSMDIARSNPLTARVVLHAKPAKGRKHRNRQGVPARNSNSRKNAQRESEPWLLVASPSLALSARQLITLYGRRMQIELSFRDLKSHRYGQGFEDSLTRKGARIEVLLLLSTMAAFATWLVGMACERCGIDAWLTPFRSRRRLYSVMRLGREALVRRWSSTRLSELISQLRHPSPQLLDQLGVPT